MRCERMAKLHRLQAKLGSDAVNVGVIDPLASPILHVQSGDEVEISTLGNWGGLVTPDTDMRTFPGIKEKFPHALGPHSITGPIHVNEAKPGDSLIVELLEIVPEPIGYNMVVASPRGRGVLRDRFPHGRITHFMLDRETMTTKLNDQITIPLQPFLGVMGVAPLGQKAISTVEPGEFGGNIDLAELVEGTQLELPVFHEGAGFYCGDGHAVQGDGEINQMAIEAGMERVRIRLSVKSDSGLKAPRAESKTHWITLGFGDRLEEAAHEAVDMMVDLLAEYYELSPADAYTLCSIAASLRVTQMVNGVVGMHAK